MKYLIKNIYLLLLFFFVSCTDKEIVDSTFTLEVRGYAEEECYTFGEEQALYLWASKNWADTRTSLVEYRVDPSVLEDYNASENTSYKLLPESCYRMVQDSFFVDDESKFAKFKIMYSPEQIIAEGGQYDMVEYALPIRIYVDGVSMEERYGSVVVGFRVNKALVSLLNTESELIYTIDPEVSQEIMIPYETNYDNLEWITLGFKIGGQLVDDYNAEHGTNYLPFPEEDLTYIASEFELAREVSLDSNAFYADMANLDAQKKYLLAIQLDNITSTKCKINPERNTRYILFYNTKIPQNLWNVEVRSSADGSGATLNNDNLSDYWLWGYWNYSSLSEQNPENITYTLVNQNTTVLLNKIELWAYKGINAWYGAKDIIVQVSTDGGSSWSEVKRFTAPRLEGNTTYFIELDESVQCNAVRLSIISGHSDGISFSEIIMHGEYTK